MLTQKPKSTLKTNAACDCHCSVYLIYEITSIDIETDSDFPAPKCREFIRESALTLSSISALY